MVNSDPGGLLLLCKALDLEWPMVRWILLLHPAGKRATPMQLHRWCEQLAKINFATATRIVRFWQVRTGVPEPAAPRPSRDGTSGNVHDGGDWTLQ